MTRAVLFDLDGTLVDTRHDLATSVNLALAEIGLPERRPAEIFGFIGEGARRLVERAIAPHTDRIEPALAAWARHYDLHLLDRSRPFPGLAELLGRLQGPLAVNTNKPGPMARRLLEGLGLAAHFAYVVGGGDVEAHKPDPAGALAILARLGLPPEQAIYVGDSRVDVETAKRCGLRFVGVAWGLGGERELREAGAREIVPDAEALERSLSPGNRSRPQER